MARFVGLHQQSHVSVWGVLLLSLVGGLSTAAAPRSASSGSGSAYKGVNRSDPGLTGRVRPTPPSVTNQLPHRQWVIEDFPNPRTDPTRCGRSIPSYICDPGRVLDRREARHLDEYVSKICHTTYCPCHNCTGTPCPGFALAIAIVPSIVMRQGEAPDEHELHEILTRWAHHLRTQAWNFGHCDNSIVVVLSVKDQKVFLSVGEVARRRMTVECTNGVYHDARGLLQQGQYASALEQMLRDYRYVLRNEFKCVIEYGTILPTGVLIGIIFASVCIPLMSCVLLVFLGPCFRGNGFGGKKHKNTACKKYRLVLLAHFKCVIAFGPIMSTGTVIAVIFGSVCGPLMICVILMFIGPCFRGNGFGGSRPSKSSCKKYRYHDPLVFDLEQM